MRGSENAGVFHPGGSGHRLDHPPRYSEQAFHSIMLSLAASNS